MRRKTFLLVICVFVFAFALSLMSTGVAFADTKTDITYSNLFIDANTASSVGTQVSYCQNWLGNFFFKSADIGKTVWIAEEGEEIAVYIKGDVNVITSAFAKSTNGSYFVRMTIKEGGKNFLDKDGKIITTITTNCAEKWFSVNSPSFDWNGMTKEGVETSDLTITAQIYEGTEYSSATLSDKYNIVLSAFTNIQYKFFAVSNIDVETLKQRFTCNDFHTIVTYGDMILGTQQGIEGKGNSTITFPVALDAGATIIMADLKGAYILTATLKDDNNNDMVDDDGKVIAVPKQSGYSLANMSNIVLSISVNGVPNRVYAGTDDKLIVNKRTIKILLNVKDEDQDGYVDGSTPGSNTDIEVKEGNIRRRYGATPYTSFDCSTAQGTSFYNDDYLDLTTVSIENEGNKVDSPVKYDAQGQIVGYQFVVSEEGYVVRDGSENDKTACYTVTFEDNTAHSYIVYPTPLQAVGFNTGVYSREFPYSAVSDYSSSFATRGVAIEGVNGESVELIYGFTANSRKVVRLAEQSPSFVDIQGGICQVGSEYTAEIVKVVIKKDNKTKEYDFTQKINYIITPCSDAANSTFYVKKASYYLVADSDTASLPAEYSGEYVKIGVPIANRQIEYGQKGNNFSIDISVNLADKTSLTIGFVLASEPDCDSSGMLVVGNDYILALNATEWNKNVNSGNYNIAVGNSFVLRIVKKKLVLSSDLYIEYGENTTYWSVALDNGIGGKEIFNVGVGGDEHPETKEVGATMALYSIDTPQSHPNYELVGYSNNEVLPNGLLDKQLIVTRRKLYVRLFLGSLDGTEIISVGGKYNKEYGDTRTVISAYYQYSATAKNYQKVDNITANAINMPGGNAIVGGYTVSYSLPSNVTNYYLGSLSDPENMLKTSLILNIIPRKVKIVYTFTNKDNTKPYYDTISIKDLGVAEAKYVTKENKLVDGFLENDKNSIVITTTCDGLKNTAKCGDYPLSFELGGKNNSDTYKNYEISELTGKYSLKVVVRNTQEMDSLIRFSNPPTVADDNTDFVTLTPADVLDTFGVEYGYGTIDNPENFTWGSSNKITGLTTGMKYYFAVRYSAKKNQNEVGSPSPLLEKITKINTPIVQKRVDEKGIEREYQTTENEIKVYVTRLLDSKNIRYNYTGSATQDDEVITAKEEKESNFVSILVFSGLKSGTAYTLSLRCESDCGGTSEYYQISLAWTKPPLPTLTNKEYTAKNGLLTFDKVNENIQYEYKIVEANVDEEELDLFYNDDELYEWSTYTGDGIEMSNNVEYILMVRVKANDGGSYDTGGLTSEKTVIRVTAVVVEGDVNYDGILGIVAKYALVGMFGIVFLLLISSIIVFVLKLKR